MPDGDDDDVEVVDLEDDKEKENGGKDDLKRSSRRSSSKDGDRDRRRSRSGDHHDHRRSSRRSSDRGDRDREKDKDRDKDKDKDRDREKDKDRDKDRRRSRSSRHLSSSRHSSSRRSSSKDGPGMPRRSYTSDGTRSKSPRHSLKASLHRSSTHDGRRSSSRDGDELRKSRSSGRDRDKDRDRDRDKDRDKGRRRARDKDKDRDRDKGRDTHRDRGKETREERDERKRKEKEEKERQKERHEKREKEREERRRKDEETKKKREELREQKRQAENPDSKDSSNTMKVNRADLRKVSQEVFNNVYRIGRQIYKGDDTRVHTCYHRATGTQRCVKITPKKSSTCHEFDMLKNMDHPNILTMYDLFVEETDMGFEWYLVIDYCKGKSLYYYLQKRSCKPGKEIMKDESAKPMNDQSAKPAEGAIAEDDWLGLGGLMTATEDLAGGLMTATEGLAGGIMTATEGLVNVITGDEKEEEIVIEEGKFYGMDETEVKQVMLQVMSCVNYLHKNNLVHADIKPQNLIMGTGIDLSTLKMLDFDNSAHLRRPEDKINFKNGTPEFMAPEVHAGNKYDYKCDIWSCGVMCYQLLTNTLPFGDSKDGMMEEEIASNAEEGNYTMAGPAWGAVSDDAKDFVKSLLILRDKKRPTAEKALVHKWLAGGTKEASGDAAAPALTLKKNDGAMKAMSNFKNFKADTKLKKATCAFIASQLLTKDEKDKIDDVFRAIDVTRDGKLSKTEVKAGFFQIFGTFMSDKEIDEMFERIDCDGTGEIEYSEFVIASMSETDLLSKDRLQKAFQLFDKDNSGSITISELRDIFSFFQTAGADMDEAYIDKVIAQVDENGDGDVSFDEFCEMMTTGIPM